VAWYAKRLTLVSGPVWGDELCEFCREPAIGVQHLLEDDGVDNDSRLFCATHLDTAWQWLATRRLELARARAGRHPQRPLA
jgi:hypothetical protein